MRSNYSDTNWRASGQKTAFVRIEKLMQEVANCNTMALLDINDPDVPDGDWTSAIEMFRKSRDLVL